MKRILIDHEFKINTGAWTGCTAGNTIDNGNGTYTIHSGLDANITIGALQVRVKAMGINPASAALLNTTAFHASVTPKKIQLFFVGDSFTAGVGTIGTGSSASGDYNGGQDFPTVAYNSLVSSGLDVTPTYRGMPGIRVDQADETYQEIQNTIDMFNKDLYTDIYVVMEWGANDTVDYDDVYFRNKLIAACNKLTTAGAKVIIVPILSRKDSYASAGGYQNIVRRNAFNTWALTNYTSFANAIVDLSGHPEVFGDDAPDNPTYFNASDLDGLSKVHPTSAGAAIIAAQVAATILTLSTTPSVPITPVDEAAAFMTALGLSNPTILSALQTYVAAEKASGVWYKLNAIYPIVGGTGDYHKYNLKNPQSTDLAYRLAYGGGAPTHDANGIFWGNASYADTKKVLAATRISAMSCSMIYYSKTNAQRVIDMGITGQAWLGINSNGGSYTSVFDNQNDGVFPPPADTRGLFITTRNSKAKSSFYKNGTFLYDKNYALPNNGSVLSVFVGGSNNGSGVQYQSERLTSYMAIGRGLNATEAAAHYAAVQALQVALGRAE